MKTNSIDLITTAIRIHEQAINEEFIDYKFEVQNTHCYTDRSGVKLVCVKCRSVIRVEDEDAERFNTAVCFDEDGNIIDII